jgi:antitoxin component HigA of HigAB toxin-antitoxin module
VETVNFNLLWSQTILFMIESHSPAANPSTPGASDPVQIIKKHLDKWGIKQKWLSEKTGLSETLISLMLKGDKPLTEASKVKIFEALEIEL